MKIRIKKLEPKTDNISAPLIQSIKIRDLFYSLSYELKATQSDDETTGKLILLYGNNGAGKTTILNCIYHLLHPEAFGGHRSFLGKIPFLDFQVHLSNGWNVRAYRESSPEPGPYHISIHEDGSAPFVDWIWKSSKENRTDQDDMEYDNLCTLLADLKLSFHYLKDSRRIEGRVEEENRYREQMIKRRLIKEERVYVVEEEDDLEFGSLQVDNLNYSIDKALQWFRKQTLSATNVGSTSVNSIYKDIIKRVYNKGELNKDTNENTVSFIIEQLEKLQTRNNNFAKYGLTSELDLGEIIDLLRSATSGDAGILNTVIGPYIEGHQARLDALQELQKLMSNFESLLEEFYSEKIIKVHVQQGLKISTITGHILKPTSLSSGEKQLLLLFCHAISSRRNGTLFIIDEPEISLNVTWQRKLIPALISCLQGTQFQLLIATHSIELISQYREFVTPLKKLE